MSGADGQGQPTSASFALPGSWWHLPLGAADVDERIRNIVRTQIGRADQFAQLRRDLADKLRSAVSAAQRANATDFYVALEIVPGVPVPVTLAAYQPDYPLGLSLEASAKLSAESLAATLERLDANATVTSWGGQEAAVARSVKLWVGDELAATGVEGALEVIASYWLVRKDASRPLLLSFSTSLASLADDLTELFDAIVATVDWPAPDVRPDASRAGRGSGRDVTDPARLDVRHNPAGEA